MDPAASSFLSSNHRLEAEDWAYCGEGSKHVVWAFCGPSASQFEGTVIRLSKDATAPSSENENDDELSASISEQFVISELFHYIDNPETITLPSTFILDLKNGALNSGKVPPGRLAKWKKWNTRTSDPVKATLMPNYRPSSFDVLSVEIKPKAGYLASSPLVYPNRRMKHYVSRYRIHQDLMHAGLLSKGWMSKDKFQKSRYDPIDLFSHNRRRITTSLEEMMENPQNNLRIDLGNELLLSRSDDRLEENKLLVHRIIFGDEGCHLNVATSRELIVQVLTDALLRDDFLALLKDLQQHDVLDADGAIMVYNRLLFLCNDDHSQAQHLVDTTNELTSLPHSLESLEYVESDGRSSVLSQFLRDSSFCERSNDEEDVTRDEVFEHGKSLIGDLCQEECVFWLQVWLFSLTMCDVSFFVQVTRLEFQSKESAVPQEWYELYPEVGESEPRAQRDSSLLYRIKMIDYDMKPASKLEHLAIKETIFDSYSDMIIARDARTAGT